MRKRMAYVAVVLAVGLGWMRWVDAAQGGEIGSLAMQDYIDIQHLYATYNTTIDNGDVEGWVEVWSEDGDFNGFVGRSELLRFARDYIEHGNGTLRRHWVNNLHIRSTPDGARASNDFMILDVSVTPPVVFSAGRNDDTFVRTPHGWRWKSRKSRGVDGEPLVITVR